MGTLVNVCGTARAGTTMLDLMLGNADDAFSCGEVYAWFRPWREHHFRLSCSCGSDSCAVWERLKDVPENMFHYEAFRHTNSRYIIDSSKELCWVIDNQGWARENRIRVVNLLVWKSPIELAFSYWKRGYGLNFWRTQFVRYHTKLFSAGIPFLSVCHDNLAHDPAGVLRQICKVIEMPYYSGKEEFWARSHHHLFGSLGTKEQIEVGQSRIEPTTFSDKFLVYIHELNKIVEKDSKVQGILRQLESFDIFSVENVSNHHGCYIKRPWWYFVERTKQKIRGKYPVSSKANFR